MGKLFGGMEGGGTKFVCVVGTGLDDIVEEIAYPTTTPDETLAKAISFFKKFNLEAIGLACFGPLDLDPASSTYGSITATPKPGWAGTNLVKRFKKTFACPVAIDTDVNAAAYGELSWISNNQNIDSLVYFTIGTGIGGGAIINRQLVHGLTHPEAGHMRIPHDLHIDPFPGVCPFHGDCFEGLACGPAIATRWGQPGETLPQNHPAWALEAAYIAAAMTNIIVILSPKRIVLGGGVMQQEQLFPLIRSNVKELLNNYLTSPVFTGDLSDFIVPPILGKRSGVLGALSLAKKS
jgi:fructokinase